MTYHETVVSAVIPPRPSQPPPPPPSAAGQPPPPTAQGVPPMLKLAAFAAVLAAEAKLVSAFTGLFSSWAGKLKSAVFGHGGIHAAGVKATAPWFAGQVDDVVMPQIGDIYRAAAGSVAAPGPVSTGREADALAAARGRILSLPERLYNSLQLEIAKARTEAWSIADLEHVLDAYIEEGGNVQWGPRSQMMSRLEAVSAHNAGLFAGFLAYADAGHGDWQKVWLWTHDHRVRATHSGKPVGVGDDRVPLRAMFTVGGAEMPYPGWPGAPLRETAGCRCSLLLVRNGQYVNHMNPLKNYGYRGRA